MKKLIWAILITVIVPVIVSACTGRSKADNTLGQPRPMEDSVIETNPEIVKGWIIEDTVIGHWAIKETKDSNDVKVWSHDRALRDTSVFLSLSYDETVVYSDKEIRTIDLVGNEGEYIMQWGGDVFWASDSAIYLSFGCLIPDSDDGWNMLCQIQPDGTSNIIVIEVGMGIDGFNVVADFMAMYLNEKAVGASAADLKRLFEHYCTEELAEELSAGTIQIVSDDTDFRHADRTTRIDNLDDLSGLPLEKYSFKVELQPDPKDENVIDMLHLEVDGTSNKISKIYRSARE